LIRAALRRPITILIAVIAVGLTAVFAISRMRADILPDLDLPVIYVAQPYGGMSPAQMEGYLVDDYEYHFLDINGIESVESKAIQNTGLLKLTFHAGTDMAEALAQTIGYVNRARAFMPPGTVANTTGRTFLIRVRGGRTEWVDVKMGLASGSLREGHVDHGERVSIRDRNSASRGRWAELRHITG
jgi:multidrug efflux pump subunit AcrB